jgi:hypothetical protein
MHDSPSIDKNTKISEPIMDYNITKGGIDTVDELCKVYNVACFTRLWSLFVFYLFMNTAGINAQTPYCSNTENLNCL